MLKKRTATELVARLPEESVARAERRCGPLRKLEVLRPKLQAVVPAAVNQRPASRRSSTFWMAMLSAAVAETVRLPASSAALGGEEMRTVGGADSNKALVADWKGRSLVGNTQLSANAYVAM